MEVVLEQVATVSDAASADSAASPAQQAVPAAVDVQNIREDASADSLSLIYQPGEIQKPHDISAKLNADAAFKALIRKHLEKYGIDSDAVAEEAFESAKEVVEAHIRRQHADRASKEFDFSGLLNRLATQDPTSLITLHLKLSDPSAGNFMAQPGDETVRVSFDGTQGVITVQGQVDAVQKFVNQIYFHADVNHLKHFWIDVKLVAAPIEKTTPQLALVSDAAAATVARAETIVEITPLSARIFMFYEKSTGFYVAQQPIKSAGAAQIANETIAILTPRGDTIHMAARELPTLQRNFIEGDAEGARGALSIEETVLVNGGSFVNVAPNAQDDAFAVAANTSLLISARNGVNGLLDNDSDGNNHPLTITAFDALSAQGYGVVDNADGTYSYTPPAGFNGNDSFTYTISDGNDGSDTATVNITVNAGPNDLTPSITDNLVGGGGADAFIGLAANWHSTDTVDGGAGADTLTITSGVLNITIDAANYTGFEEVETLVLPDAAHSITIDNDYFTRGAGPTGNQFAIDANVATADVTINASTVAAPNALNITTGTGDDSITTGAGNDTIISGDGNDVIDAGLGQNSIDAGAGNDQVTTSWSVETTPDIVNSANLVMWLDAADLDGDGLQEGTAEATRAGGNVVSWVDKAALGGVNSVTNLAGSGTIVTGGVASLDTVQYIGGAIGVATSPFGATNAESTIFFVTQENARGNNILFNFNGNDGVNRYLLHAPWSDGTWYYDPGQWNGAPNNRVAVGGNQTAVGAVTLTTGTKSVLAGQNTLSLNGGTSTGNSGNSTVAPTNNGVQISSGTNGAQHEIAEVIVFDTVLNAAQIEQVESYLAYKWGTQALLPGGHSFAAAKPNSDDTIEGGAGNDTLIISANKVVTDFDGTNNISGFETINLSGNDNAHNLTFTDGYFTAGTGVTGNRLSLTLTGNALGATIVASTVSVAYAFTLTGGNGADSLSTGAGNDIIIGNAGNDSMNGGAGDDTITGGHDNDTIIGGGGIDRFIIVNDPDDAVNGGTTEITDFVVNTERIDLSAFGANEFTNLTLTNIGPDVQIDLAGIGGAGQLLLLRNVLAAQLDADDFIGLSQNVLTSLINDILTTTTGNDAFSGTAANWHTTDSVAGGAGNDTLTITAGAVNITIDAVNYTGFEEVETLVLPDAVHDITIDDHYFDRGAAALNTFTISATASTQSLEIDASAIADATHNLNVSSGSGNDFISLGAGNDTTDGGTGNDTIFAGAGADDIRGGGNNDIIYGDEGTYQFTNGFIVIEAENFENKIDSANHSFEVTPYAPASGGLVAYMDDNGGEGGNGGERLDYSVSFDSAGTYYVWVRGTTALSAGATGKDDSLLIGLNGVNLSGAFPTGVTGYNNGLLWNTPATRTTMVIAAPGEYTLNLFAREDGFAADQILITNNAGFTPVGAASNQTIRVSSAGGNDTLLGSAGNDTIYGDFGNDTISGGSGNDHIYGGIGQDELDGGSGSDVFYFNAVTDSSTGTPDLITNFETGIDDINLAALGLAFNVASADGSAGNGAADFTVGPGGPEIAWGQGGGNTTIFIDSNGDDIADMEIILSGLINLAHADFVF